MAMTDKEKIDKFTHSYINDDFGLTIDQIATKVGGYGRFNAWLGGNQTKIKKVLQTVKDNGVSPAFFAAYEVNEGYTSPWGWLNHTYAKGDYLTDAISVTNVIKNQANNMNGQPAWADSANSPWTPPADVVAAGNKDFKENMVKGTIGRAYIPLTAAATWAAYYPKGLQAAYNGVQTYGNPFLDAANTILRWGGKLDGKGGSPSDSGGSTGSDSGGTNPITAAFKAFLDKIQDAMTWDLHSIGNDKYFSNSFFSLDKTFNNTYRIKMNLPLLNMMKDLMNSIDTGSNGSSSGGDSSDDKDSPAIKGKSVKPNGKSGKVIGGNWTWEQLPQKYKDAITLPRFKHSYVQKPHNRFVATGNTGQCTELTWGYMSQLWGKEQPQDDGQITNGQRVWYVYQKLGAKTTHNATVGYGFSSKPPYINAAIQGIGHTGVVVAVFEDGSFLICNWNVGPYWAPSRVDMFSLIDGVPYNAGDNIVFFSGIK